MLQLGGSSKGFKYNPMRWACQFQTSSTFSAHTISNEEGLPQGMQQAVICFHSSSLKVKLLIIMLET